MSQLEMKELRSKLLNFQLWMEKQVALGLLDIENTPKCFDRASNTLKEMIEKDKTIGSHCHFCDHKFLPGENKKTVNHIMYFHPGCMEKFDKEEEQSLRHE